MDGDLAPLSALADLAALHDAMLLVDEAHSVGTRGPFGAGLAAELGIVPDVHVGTLGKALGSFGAYIAGSKDLAEFLISRARSFVFTTALPPAVTAASLAAVHLVRGALGESRRIVLRERVAQFRAGLAAHGLLAHSAGETPIFPILIGDNARAMECSRHLLALGIYAQGIRPPTVPDGTARLRFSITASHGPADVERAIEALRSCQAARLVPDTIPGRAPRNQPRPG
jgi:7-keto-8-aminopelargonate synthetase-like enzyme